MAGNNKFIEALDILENERGVKKEVVLDALKEALEKSYKKNYLSPDSIVRVDIDPKTAHITLHEIKTVVDDVEDEDIEISLEEAQEINPNYQVGDIIESAVSPEVFGRLAAVQTKQILRQKIREAEKESLYNEYIDKKDEIITGTVDRVEERFAIINIGSNVKTGAYLPASQQIPGEHLKEGQKIKVYVSNVDQGPKGVQIDVSRTDTGLVKRLFELEVPEIYDGKVEIISVSREPGERSKIAVYTTMEEIDAIGACVGQKGMRVKNIVDELDGEMIDIVEYSKDPATFIKNALSPSAVIHVDVNEDEKSALVIVPNNQLSLAIGKRGQNARLAARLTGWKIDIKSLNDAVSEGLYHVEEQHDDYKDIEEEMLHASENEVEEVVEDLISEDTIVDPVYTEKLSKEVQEDDDYYDDNEYSKYDEEIDYDEYDKYYDED